MDAEIASIKKLRDDGKTLKEIAGIFGVSAARIGQLRKAPPERCAIHRIARRPQCHRCAKKAELDEVIRRFERDGLMTEIQNVSARDRSHEMVARRTALVKKFRDRYGLSFVAIGRLLNRHHASIMNLYYCKRRGRSRR